MKRWNLILAGLSIIALFCLSFWMLYNRPRGIPFNQELWAKSIPLRNEMIYDVRHRVLRKGLSGEEVIRILGKPGKVLQRKEVYRPRNNEDVFFYYELEREEHHHESHHLIISFDSNMRLVNSIDFGN